MAICYWDAKMLWSARLRGVLFERTATLGHLSLYLHPSEVAYFKQEYCSYFPDSIVEPLKDYTFGKYSDDFLVDFLGVKHRMIVDASAYEGANTIHDLNYPIPDSLRNSFDVVIDCGTLEHVFNFPTAIGNLMKITDIGGVLFISTPSNNLCGHGFFQFSPELMFRIFTKDNGFELKRIVVTEGVFPSFEMSPHQEAYEVTDPEIVRSRVGILSRGPVTMIVEAVKLADVPLFEKFPMQSDYVSLWGKSEGDDSYIKPGVKRVLKAVYETLPQPWSSWIAGRRQKKKFSLSNKKYFRMLD